METDIVKDLGHMTLGTRLKRLGELLQAQTGEITCGDLGYSVPVPQNPVLAALDRCGPMTIGQLSRELGQSQPGITRMINQMKGNGLVAGATDPDDRRLSRIALTNKGRTLTSQLKNTLWPATASAVADACSDLHGDLLDQLNQLEANLVSNPLKQRASSAPPDDAAKPKKGSAS